MKSVLITTNLASIHTALNRLDSVGDWDVVGGSYEGGFAVAAGSEHRNPRIGTYYGTYKLALPARFLIKSGFPHVIAVVTHNGTVEGLISTLSVLGYQVEEMSTFQGSEHTEYVHLHSE